LIGHVHQSQTSMNTGFTGTLFTNIAPSALNDIRSDSRKFSNGFTVIDFKKNDEINCQYFRYNHIQKEYVINSDLGDNGIFRAKIPNEKSKKKSNLHSNLLNNIKEDHYKSMDEHLIGSKAINSPLSLKDAFILPPITDGVMSDIEDDSSADLTISEIIKSKYNFMFFGDQESGKTTILFRLVREFIEEFAIIQKIPVYIDFDELRNKELLTVIKEYLRCSSDEAKILVQDKQLVLLIDNLNYKKDLYLEQRAKLHKFANENQEIQIIATAENLTTCVLPTDYIAYCKIPFKNFFIKNLRAKEIKTLMKQWLPNETELNTDIRLEKLVDSFRSYALPSSVMSVSLFLWSMEYSDRKPINNAVLMEIYIEILLEKLGKHNVYRENFDFTNKIHLLARIAQEMLDSNEPNYAIPYSDFLRIVENYLNEVGFGFDAKIIVTYFLDRKVFVTHQNRIKFAYSCFFHFFIAKRMIFNHDFKAQILHEDNYMSFSKEIDYYSGLVRNDEPLLSDILDRLEKAFVGTEFILTQINIDKYFTDQANIIDGTEEHVPIAKKIEIKEIKENRPSTEMLEEFYNKQLNDIPNPGTILKKEDGRSLEALLVMMANVLRNSEGVENRTLKQKAYNAQIKYSLIWTILYREYLLDYVYKNKSIPPSIPSVTHLVFLLKNLPLAVQGGLHVHAGTPKLAPIILEKLKDDLVSKSISDIETFLSVFLYADIEGNDFPKYLKALVKSTGRNIVRDYAFMKIQDYYYRRTRPDSPNEKVYLDLLTELKIRTKKIPHQLRDRVIKAIEDGKRALQQ
jgi:hypothetical protein